MTNEEMFERIPPVPEGSTFYLEKVKTLCTPHPYCITPKHISVAADYHGGILSKEAMEDAERRGAKCGHCPPGDVKSLAEHESVKSLLIRVPGKLKSLKDVPGLHGYLLSINDEASALGIQGYGFPPIP